MEDFLADITEEAIKGTFSYM